MAKNHFLAGVGRALLFRGNNLIGVSKTLTESTFDFTITAEEIRGGAANALWGKYFHDSNLAVTLTDSMFNIEYIAASLGVNVESGGISIKEEEVVAASGKATVTETPVAFDGTMIGWYKKPSESEWTIGTLNGKDMTIPGAKPDDVYCVKYFYQNSNAKSILIKTQYVPATLHVVIINDLFAGDVNDAANATRYGRLITDIPRLQLDGNQNLSLTSSGAATVSLTGSALAVASGDSCEEDPFYGTMTEEIFGGKWQDDAIAIAVENGDVALKTSGEETLAVRVLFGGSMLPARKDSSNFTFAVEATPTATATGVQVDATGKVSAGDVQGVAIVSVTLKDAPHVEPTYVKVNVTQ